MRKRQRKKNRTKPRLTAREVRFWRREPMSILNPLLVIDCLPGGMSGRVGADGNIAWTEMPDMETIREQAIPGYHSNTARVKRIGCFTALPKRQK